MKTVLAPYPVDHGRGFGNFSFSLGDPLGVISNLLSLPAGRQGFNSFSLGDPLGGFGFYLLKKINLPRPALYIGKKLKLS
jgi:hypothetical protein